MCLTNKISFKLLAVAFQFDKLIMGGGLFASPLYLLTKRNGNGDETTKIFLYQWFLMKKLVEKLT